ncbi:hypothetical protein PV325_002358 [Microctonus aethiopoides]|nr:hypothetical protein PV325_002358 [Microctonus aethiopoides]
MRDDKRVLRKGIEGGSVDERMGGEAAADVIALPRSFPLERGNQENNEWRRSAIDISGDGILFIAPSAHCGLRFEALAADLRTIAKDRGDQTEEDDSAAMVALVLVNTR